MFILQILNNISNSFKNYDRDIVSFKNNNLMNQLENKRRKKNQELKKYNRQIIRDTVFDKLVEIQIYENTTNLKNPINK